MKVLIATDSFKGSLTAKEACLAIEEGIKSSNPDIITTLTPLADGGEGTAEIITQQLGGKTIECHTQDPLNRPIKASFGILPDNTAIIDMAAASGITLLREDDKNPLITNTYGTGLLIREALKMESKKIIIGLGGSATNDGGTGMAAALGYSFLDKKGKNIPLGGIYLNSLHKINFSEKDKRLSACKFVIASDVTNLLTGENGASYTFGPQKGASSSDLTKLDNAMKQLAKCIKKELKKDVLSLVGGGAAGGMGAGCVAFLNGNMSSGFDLVARHLQLESNIKVADIIITGEGYYDSTSANGKVISGVLKLAQKHKKQTIIIAGDAQVKNDKSIPIFTLVNENTSPTQAMTNAKILIKKRAEHIFNVVLPQLNAKK